MQSLEIYNNNKFVQKNAQLTKKPATSDTTHDPKFMLKYIKIVNMLRMDIHTFWLEL